MSPARAEAPILRRATAAAIVRPADGQPRGKTAERVVDHVIGYIRRRKLPAGSTLPPEVRTSARLRISRGIVREAYRSLSAAGIIEITNGRSPRVGRMTSRALTQVLQHALATRQASVEQIFELRRPIEEQAAELAALHRTSEDLDALRRAVTAMHRAGSRRESYVKADIRFHEALGAATGNPLFSVIGSALRAVVSLSIRASYEARRSRAEIDAVVDTHGRIVDAIEAGKPADAHRLMAQHFDEAAAPIRRETSDPGQTR